MFTRGGGGLGCGGPTAHYGLTQLGKPQPGDTVVVSAASGAVGSLVGQIAKIKGCRVVGIAGGPEKCRYVTEELGFDACLDYGAPDLVERFIAATPDYVDVSFENVGGPIMDMVMGRLNAHARVVLCGAISQYNTAAAAPGSRCSSWCASALRSPASSSANTWTTGRARSPKSRSGSRKARCATAKALPKGCVRRLRPLWAC